MDVNLRERTRASRAGGYGATCGVNVSFEERRIVACYRLWIRLLTRGAMRSSIGPCRVLQKRSIMLVDTPLWPAVLKP